MSKVMMLAWLPMFFVPSALGMLDLTDIMGPPGIPTPEEHWRRRHICIARKPSELELSFERKMWKAAVSGHEKLYRGRSKIILTPLDKLEWWNTPRQRANYLSLLNKAKANKSDEANKSKSDEANKSDEAEAMADMGPPGIPSAEEHWRKHNSFMDRGPDEFDLSLERGCREEAVANGGQLWRSGWHHRDDMVDEAIAPYDKEWWNTPQQRANYLASLPTPAEKAAQKIRNAKIAKDDEVPWWAWVAIFVAVLRYVFEIALGLMLPGLVFSALVKNITRR